MSATGEDTKEESPVPEAPGTPTPAADGTTATAGAALSKKKQKKANKVTQKIKVQDGSVDAMVQHTNDDSVVGKRSAVVHGYIRDRFLRCFVKKPSRRSPLINRGYYLRMAVMTDLVVRLIPPMLRAPERQTSGDDAKKSLQPVQVLSLGAGYDTLAMRLLLDSVDVLHPAGSSTTSDASFTNGDVLFVDVDFPAVLQSKAALMAAAPPQSFPPDWKLAPQSLDCPVTSPSYAAVGVDLRTASAELLPRLHHYGPAGFAATNPTIIYAECVMQYMPSEDAERLVHLLAASFPNAVFLAYDQVSPADSFGHVMQQSLRQKNSPLLGIQACPDGPHMARRALQSGMQRAWWADFYRVSRHVLSGAEQARVEALEPFDELEEWSEMCAHYGITMATTHGVWDSVIDEGCAAHPAFVEYNSEGKPPPTRNAATSGAVAAVLSFAPPRVVSGTLHNWPSARYGFEGWGNGGVAVEPVGNGDHLLVSFGGFAVAKQHQRVSTIYVHSLQEGELRVVVAGGEAPAATHNGTNASLPSSPSAAAAGAAGDDTHPPALVFHSFTRIGKGQYLAWGGRTNPTAASNHAYLLTLDIPRSVSLGSTIRARWTLLSVSGAESCPPPRFRHSMVCLHELDSANTRLSDAATLLLLGGKCWKKAGAADETTSTSENALDCFRVTVSPGRSSISYEVLDCSGAAAPAALHSAAALAISGDAVLLSGGVFSNRDECNSSLWRLSLSRKEWTRLPVNVGIGRYAHSLTRVVVNHQAYVLVLGGSTWVDKSLVPAALLVPWSAVAEATNGAASPCVGVSLPVDVPWWSRHSCVSLGDGVVGILGGGYTCFSFGTFAAKPQLLYIGDSVNESAWRVHRDAAHKLGDRLETQHDAKSHGGASARGPASLVYSYDQLLSKPWPRVREVAEYSEAAFLAVARAAREPVVFRRVPLGACVQQWRSPRYLKETEGDAVVSVHVAEKSQLLDFVRKNFAFRHVTLAQLVDHVEEATTLHRQTRTAPAETWYYRSIAAHMKSERSNLWTDFLALGKDFVLPPGAQEYIVPRLHQSCLRMNAPPLQLWTHFDTLDNVLCQIVGRKRVVLFPPCAYNNLYMTGSSSAVINLDAPDLVRYPKFVEACKAAREVILEPGDMLYFPAMWFHHITTLEEAAAEQGDDGSNHESKAVEHTPYNISVNVFYRHFEDTAVYDARDLYGNKDILAVTRLREELQTAVQQVLREVRLDAKDGASPPVPSEYVEFALRQFMQDTERMATDMADQRHAA